MRLTTGERLQSTACTTEIIVIKGVAEDVDLRCGGSPMVPSSAEGNGQTADLSADFSGGSLLGKRYGLASVGLEVLVTKPGDGTLSLGDEALAMEMPRELPSSD